MTDRYLISAGDGGGWLSDSDHGLDRAAVEAAAREFVLSRGDDPDRLIYGRRLKADLSTSATCPMVPYWEFIAGHVIVAIKTYQQAGGILRG